MKRLRVFMGITFVLAGLSAQGWCILDRPDSASAALDSKSSVQNDSKTEADNPTLAAADQKATDTAADKDKITDDAVLGESDLTISRK